jgi:hypothetical protein
MIHTSPRIRRCPDTPGAGHGPGPVPPAHGGGGRPVTHANLPVLPPAHHGPAPASARRTGRAGRRVPPATARRDRP